MSSRSAHHIPPVALERTMAPVTGLSLVAPVLLALALLHAAVAQAPDPVGVGADLLQPLPPPPVSTVPLTFTVITPPPPPPPLFVSMNAFPSQMPSPSPLSAPMPASMEEDDTEPTMTPCPDEPIVTPFVFLPF
eukprot:TRINITY_DN2780_c0_g1_i1.p1 TRINITY_DN2780_c0_g1~~TRINITY_DN2780_c0_g1_i1.p1  ORF type:complete len:134 (-),score=31.01 TRINITY_DN2780_c0_g1_i1:302-703(-)